MRYKLGDLVELVTETNSEQKYGLADIVGVTLEKQMIPTIANLTQTDLGSFIIVHPKDFVYNPRTHGKKIGLGFNTTNRCFISTWNNNTFRVKPTMNNVIIPEFLYMYFLRERWDKEACFNAWGSSTVVLLWSSFCNMTINVPSVDEQKKIVRAYQIITERIALLRKINNNLEDIARALYNQTIRSKTEDDLESVYSVLKVINGSPFSSDLFNANEIGFPLIRIRDLTTCSPEVYTSEMLNNMEYIHSGDILIGMDGEFIPHIWFGDIGVLNQRVCKVVPVESFIHPLFLYWTLKPILAEIQRTQGGTTVIHIGKKDFDKMQVYHISKEEHLEFKRKVEPIYNQILYNYQEILKIAQMQPLLLSKLSC